MGRTRVCRSCALFVQRFCETCLCRKPALFLCLWCVVPVCRNTFVAVWVHYRWKVTLFEPEPSSLSGFHKLAKVSSTVVRRTTR